MLSLEDHPLKNLVRSPFGFKDGFIYNKYDHRADIDLVPEKDRPQKKPFRARVAEFGSVYQNSDIIDHILGFLSDTPKEWMACARVCRLWRQVVLDRVSNLTQLKIGIDCPERNRAALEYFVTHCRKLQILKASCWVFALDIALQNPLLRVFDCPCGAYSIQHDQEHSLIDKLVREPERKLSPSDGFAQEADILQRLAKKCPLLKTLNIRVGHGSVMNVGLDGVTDLFPRLVHFGGMTTEHIVRSIDKKNLGGADLRKIMNHSGSLTSLKLALTRDTGASTEQLMEMIKSVPQLKSLVLSDFDDDPGIAHKLDDFQLESKTLQHLKFDLFMAIDIPLSVVSLPELRTLKVDNFQHPGYWNMNRVNWILFACPKLDSVSVQFMIFDFVDGQNQGEFDLPDEHFLPCLKELNLSVQHAYNGYGDGFCIQDVTKYFVDIAKAAPSLEKLAVQVFCYGERDEKGNPISHERSVKDQRAIDMLEDPEDDDLALDWDQIWRDRLVDHPALQSFSVNFYERPKPIVYFER